MGFPAAIAVSNIACQDDNTAPAGMSNEYQPGSPVQLVVLPVLMPTRVFPDIVGDADAVISWTGPVYVDACAAFAMIRPRIVNVKFIFILEPLLLLQCGAVF
jgi:hypothetical protein